MTRSLASLGWAKATQSSLPGARAYHCSHCPPTFTQPCLPGTAADLVIELQVPAELGAPRRVSGPTAAEWCPARRALRWTMGGVYAGFRGSAAAAFRVDAGAAAAVALLPALHAVVRVRGEPGETLTGLQLAQATSTAEGGGMRQHPETSGWAGCVLARPALYEGGEFAVVEGLWGAEEAAAADAEPAAAAATEAAAAAEKGEADGGAAAAAAAAAAAGVAAAGVASADVAPAAPAAEPDASPAPPAATAQDGGAGTEAPAAETDPPSQQGTEGPAQPEADEAQAAAEAKAEAEAETGTVAVPAETEAGAEAAEAAGTAEAEAADVGPVGAAAGAEGVSPEAGGAATEGSGVDRESPAL